MRPAGRAPAAVAPMAAGCGDRRFRLAFTIFRASLSNATASFGFWPISMARLMSSSAGCGGSGGKIKLSAAQISGRVRRIELDRLVAVGQRLLHFAMRAQHRGAAQICALGIRRHLDGLRVIVQRLSGSSQLLMQVRAQQVIFGIAGIPSAWPAPRPPALPPPCRSKPKPKPASRRRANCAAAAPTTASDPQRRWYSRPDSSANIRDAETPSRSSDQARWFR